MRLTCDTCHQGNIGAQCRCNNCGKEYSFDKVLDYSQVSYFLSEMRKTDWQAVVRKDTMAQLLYPYRINQRQVGMELGLMEPQDPALRRIKYLAIYYLLEDLEKLAPPSLIPLEKSQLVSFIYKERALLLEEYKFVGQAPPENTDQIDIEENKLILQSCLSLLGLANRLNRLDEAASRTLNIYYTQELAELEDVLAAARKAPEVVAPQVVNTPALAMEPLLTTSLTPAQVEPIWPVSKPKKIRSQFKWEQVWGAILSETTLRVLLYLGALFVVVAATLYITLNWNQFSPLIQAGTLLLVDLAFYGAGLFTLKKLHLRRAGATFVAIGLAILPLAIFGFSRPELIELDSRSTWTLVSLAALPVYLVTSWFIKERIFSYMSSLAALNVCWSLLYLFNLAPEWIAVATIPLAAGLVWTDRRLKANSQTEELAFAPFWVGQAAAAGTALGLLGFLIFARANGMSNTSQEWALGIIWWSLTLFYAWCASHSNSEKWLLFPYGAAISGLVAFYLSLQKLEIPFEWQGFVLGLFGMGYLAFQTSRDLAPRLNADHNATTWHLSEVMTVRKPFYDLGWVLVISTPLLARSGLTLALGLGLITLALILATLIYNWKWAAFGVMATTTASGTLLALQLPIYVWSNKAGWGLAAVALVGLGLWQLTRRSKNRFNYFSRPFEILGLLATLGLLFIPAIYLRESVFWDTLERDWLLLSALCLGLAWFYRLSLGTYGALFLAATVIGLKIDNLALGWLLAGLICWLAGLGIAGLFKSWPRSVFGVPLVNWGYLLASGGVLISGLYWNNTFLLTSGLYIGLMLASTSLTHYSKLDFWPEIVPKLFKGNALNYVSSLWLYPALALFPLWLIKAFAPLKLADMGLILGGLAGMYFIVGLGLARLRCTETSKVGPYSLASLLAWLLLSPIAIFFTAFNSWQALAVGLVLLVSYTVATFRFKASVFNWPVSGLIIWLVINLALLTKLNVYWWPLVFVGVAAVKVATGESLGKSFGLPMRIIGQLFVLGISVPLALTVLIPAFFFSWNRYYMWNTEGLIAFTPAFLVAAGLYAGLAVGRHRAIWLYLMGWFILPVVPGITFMLNASLQWPIVNLTAWSYLGLAALAVVIYPYSSKVFKFEAVPVKWGLDKNEVLSHLAHAWAGLAFLVALYDYGQWSLATILAGLLVLYTARSWNEHRAELLGVASVAGGLATAYSMYRLGASLSLNGLALVGLAAIYLDISWFFWYKANANHTAQTTKLPAVFNWELASRIFSLSGKSLILLGVLMSLTNEVHAIWALVLTLVLTGWLAWKEHIIWGAVSLLSGIAAFGLGYDWLGISWNWFGMALFIPAALAGTLAWLFLRSNKVNYWQLGAIYASGAAVLVISGLPFSWQQDYLLLAHSLIIATLGAGLWRSTRRHEWLYLILGAEHLAYLTGLELLASKTGLSLVQAGLGLLPVGLIMAAVAVLLGLDSGNNLRWLVGHLPGINRRQTSSELLRAASLPFYLAATLDLMAGLILTAGDSQAGMIVAGTIAATLLMMAWWEAREELVWLALGAVGVASLFGLVLLGSSFNLTFIIMIGGSAAGLVGLSYAVGRGRALIYYRPAWYSSLLLALLNPILWLITLAQQGSSQEQWELLSWVLGWSGLYGLLVASLESQRKPSLQDKLRYLGYGAVLLLELAFSLRLLLVNVSQIQLYVLPIGLTCLVIGWLEQLKHNHRSAPLLEAVGLILVLGTTLLQAFNFQTNGLNKSWYGWIIVFEGLLITGLGAANRLRYYFFGGITAVLLGLVALLIDPVRTANMWLTLGITGLVLIGLALFLEHKREVVIRLTKDWLYQLKQWE